MDILWRVVDLRGDLHNRYRMFLGGVKVGCWYRLRSCVKDGEESVGGGFLVGVEGGDG